MDHEKVSQVVEAICNLGCSRVTSIIEILEQDEPVDQARELDIEERTLLLCELKAIMSVYDHD
jgi:hypothetical protein